VELEAQARIHALQARIRPHFLFNSMNTIAALTRSDAAKAEQAVEDLADLFRASLSDAKQRITLGDEIEIARVYERMERLRLGDRLRVVWHIDTPLDVMVPSLLLQPLLENAIYHGIERLPAGGEVQITGKVVASYIQLIIANPVPNPHGVEAARDAEHSGNKLALDNIRKRMQLVWPGKARVVVDQTPGYYSVTLTFPHLR
jgi:two-component system sensor histidine kinase AlgZ